MPEPLQPVVPSNIRVPAGVTPIQRARDLVEAPEDRDARLAAAAKARTDRWQRRVPLDFRDASLDDLDEEQDPEGKIRSWWEKGGRHLVLLGKSGRGKTHAGYAVGNAAVSTTEHLWAASWFVPDLNSALRPGGDESAMEVACEADLVFLDDLGREKISEWTLESLTKILDARAGEHKRTIFTTNLEGEAMLTRYGDPVVDRIKHDMWLARVGGESRRAVAPW